MYSEELDSSKRAIAIMALRKGISVEQIRAEIQEAIHASFVSTDPKVKEQCPSDLHVRILFAELFLENLADFFARFFLLLHILNGF